MILSQTDLYYDSSFGSLAYNMKKKTRKGKITHFYLLTFFWRGAGMKWM